MASKLINSAKVALATTSIAACLHGSLLRAEHSQINTEQLQRKDQPVTLSPTTVIVGETLMWVGGIGYVGMSVVAGLTMLRESLKRRSSGSSTKSK